MVQRFINFYYDSADNCALVAVLSCYDFVFQCVLTVPVVQWLCGWKSYYVFCASGNIWKIQLS